jgi:putative heme-binding domain-containing protein
MFDSRLLKRALFSFAAAAARYRNEVRHESMRFMNLGAVLFFLSRAARAQDRPRAYPEADIDNGARIFAVQCSTCRGLTGDRVAGVNFRSGQFKHVASDADLRNVVTSGVPRTPMPPHNFDPPQLTAIAAFIRNFGSYNPRGAAIRDIKNGEALFNGKGNCGSCHRVNRIGPRVAPDLSNIGPSRSADLLQRTLVDPTGAMLPVNRSVHAVTKDGEVVAGRRLNEDTYTVQIIDDREQLVSLEKSNLSNGLQTHLPCPWALWEQTRQAIGRCAHVGCKSTSLAPARLQSP